MKNLVENLKIIEKIKNLRKIPFWGNIYSTRAPVSWNFGEISLGYFYLRELHSGYVPWKKLLERHIKAC